MRAIPLPVRQRIIELYEQGRSTREIADFAGFCVAAVRRVRQQFKARGTLQPQTHLCGRKTLLTRARQVRPFGTSTVDLWLRKLGLSCKKNDARRRAATARRGSTKGSVA